MAKIVGLLLLILVVVNTSAQDYTMPYFQCGSSYKSYYPKIEVTAKPIGYIDTARISLIIDGDTLGFAYYQRWEFEVETRLNGFCNESLTLPLLNENDSLQFEKQVHLEIVRYEDTVFALLASISAQSKTIEHNLKKLESPNLEHGKLLSIEHVSSEVDLSNYGIDLNSTHAKSFGYDTASIFDKYYKLQFKTENDTQIIYIRELKHNNAAQFEIGATYLFQYYVQDDLKWIDIDILFRENYHNDEYFKAYEKQD